MPTDSNFNWRLIDLVSQHEVYTTIDMLVIKTDLWWIGYGEALHLNCTVVVSLQ